MLERMREYIGHASGKAGQDIKGKDKVSDEDLREDLSLTANPKSTTSFNGKNVMIALGLVGTLFTGCFIYGIATASNHQKNKAAQTSVETANDGQQDHLKNAPGSYDDSKTKRYDKEQKDKDKDNQKNRHKNTDNDDDYRPAPRPVQAYTPVPQSSYRMTTPRPNIPANPAVSHGMTEEQKIAAAKAKEKMEANQSPIGFKLSEDKDAR